MPPKKSSFYSLYFTIFNDSLTWGVVLTLFAPMLLDYSLPFLPVTMGTATRTIIIGFLIAIFGLGQFIAAPMLGALSDHIGRKKVLLISLWGSAFSSALSAIGVYSYSIVLLFISRLLAGGASGNLPIAQASIADLSTEKNKAKNLSLVGTMAGIAWIIGPPIGGKLADPKWFNFAAPFWFVAASFAINAIMVHFQFRETFFKEVKEGHGLKEEFRAIVDCFTMPKVKWVLLANFLQLLGWFSFLFFYPTYFVQKFGLNQSEIGNYSGYLSLWFLGANLYFSKYMSHKIEPKHLIVLPLILLAGGIFVSLGFTKAWYFLFTFPFISIGSALSWVGFMAILSNLAGEKNQGKIFGVMQSIQSIGLFLSPFLSGFFSAKNQGLPLLLGVIFLLVSAFCHYFFYIRREKRR